MISNSNMPAMPVSRDTDSAEGVYLIGFTKREEIASRNLAAFLSNSGSMNLGHEDNIDLVIETATRYADALLKKLEESK